MMNILASLRVTVLENIGVVTEIAVFSGILQIRKRNSIQFLKSIFEHSSLFKAYF